jgi:hypothetical protein
MAAHALAQPRCWASTGAARSNCRTPAAAAWPAHPRSTMCWATRLVDDMRHPGTTGPVGNNASRGSGDDLGGDLRGWTSALSLWPLPPLAGAARARRRELRGAWAAALNHDSTTEALQVGPNRTLARRCRVPVPVPAGEDGLAATIATRAAAEAALVEGLGLSRLLPHASAEAVADMHADILACVALWAGVTRRSSASVGVSIVSKRRRNLRLHLDHVDARVLCTLHGKGTEWVAAPAGWLHTAASFSDHGRGGAVADILKEAMLEAAGRGAAPPLRAAGEREAVLIRGTANAAVRRGQARCASGPFPPSRRPLRFD